MKIGIIGDCHFKENLGYADYLPDGRRAEFQAVLDTVVKFFKNSDTIVFLGDNFDVKNPTAKVIRAFTEFLERFNGKKIYILAGNHEKSADGTTAIDYLREIKNPNWHIITKRIEEFDGLVFCPYYYKQELKAENYEEATKILLAILGKGGKYLFAHHAISDTLTFGNQTTNVFDEIVFPKTLLEKYFEIVVGGHIHRPQQYGRTLVAGSLFPNEAGDRNNAVWELDTVTNTFKKCLLPVRYIYRLENPTVKTLNEPLIANNSIVKAVLTEKTEEVEAIKEAGKRFDAFILQEQYPHERKKKSVTEDNLLEANIETLIKYYAVSKKLDPKPLLEAWERNIK